MSDGEFEVYDHKKFEVLVEEEKEPKVSKEKVTLPLLSKFEKTRVLALRAGQLSKGAPAYTRL